MSGRTTRVLLGAVVAAGAALRFATLGVQSYWLDEAATVLLLRHDLGGALSEVAEREATPPGYFVLAWLWSQVFGTGEVGLRSLSALLGTLAIPVAYAIGRRVASQRAGLVAALLVAVNPFLLWYSQEARAYALLVLLCGVATVLWLDALRDPRGRMAVAWGAVAAAAVLTHYFAALLLVPQAAVLVARSPLPRTAKLAAVGLPAVTALALAPLLAAQRDERVSWVEAHGMGTRAADLVKHWIIGPAGTPWDALGLLALLLAVIGLAAALLRRPSAPVLWLAATAAAAVALAVVLAVAGLDYVLDRYLVASLVPVLVLIAAGLASLPWGSVAAAGLAALLVCFGVVQVADPDLRRNDWRSVARTIAGAPRPAAVEISVQGLPPLQAYLPDSRAMTAPAPAATVATAVELHPGDPPPPSPPPPPGFTLAGRDDGPTTTLVSYAAPDPVPIDPAAVGATALAGGDAGGVLWLP